MYSGRDVFKIERFVPRSVWYSESSAEIYKFEIYFKFVAQVSYKLEEDLCRIDKVVGMEFV